MKFLVDNLSATQMDHRIDMLRLEQTFISGNVETIVDIIPHSYRGNNFLFALHISKSQIKETTAVEIEELFSKYFDPYMIQGYMWTKLAEFPNTSYRFIPDREVKKVISLEDTYLLHIEVRYTNAKYIPDAVNNGYDYPFPVVKPDRIISMLEKNVLVKEVAASETECQEVAVKFDADIIHDLRTELCEEKVKVAALQDELARNSEKLHRQKLAIKNRTEKIVLAERCITALNNSVNTLKDNRRITENERGEMAGKQQAFIRKLYLESNRKDNCPVCYETITSENLYVSDCCHVYCMSCAQGCYKGNQKCAMCRTNLGTHNKKILRAPMTEEEALQMGLEILSQNIAQSAFV